MYKYFFAYDDGNILIRHNDGDSPETFIIQRYDEKKEEWITDYLMSGIFSGDIPVKSITEKEAMGIIKNYDSN